MKCWTHYFSASRNIWIGVERADWIGLGWEWDSHRYGWRIGVRVGLAFVSARFLFVSRNG